MLLVSTGLLPWNAVPGKACGMTLLTVCKTEEVRTVGNESAVLSSPPNPPK